MPVWFTYSSLDTCSACALHLIRRTINTRIWLLARIWHRVIKMIWSRILTAPVDFSIFSLSSFCLLSSSLAFTSPLLRSTGRLFILCSPINLFVLLFPINDVNKAIFHLFFLFPSPPYKLMKPVQKRCIRGSEKETNGKKISWMGACGNYGSSYFEEEKICVRF